MDPVASTALSGLMASVARLNVSASNTANSQADGPLPRTPPSQPLPAWSGGPAVASPNVDLVAERVQQITARSAFMANLAVLKTAGEMEQSLLDVKA